MLMGMGRLGGMSLLGYVWARWTWAKWDGEGGGLRGAGVQGVRVQRSGLDLETMERRTRH